MQLGVKLKRVTYSALVVKNHNKSDASDGLVCFV